MSKPDVCNDYMIKPKSGVRFVTVTINDILGSIHKRDTDSSGEIVQFFSNMYACIDKTYYPGVNVFIDDICRTHKDDTPIATIAYQIADIKTYYDGSSNMYAEGYVVGYSLISRHDEFNGKKGRKLAKAHLDKQIEYRNTQGNYDTPLNAPTYNGFCMLEPQIVIANSQWTKGIDDVVIQKLVSIFPKMCNVRSIAQKVKRNMIIDAWLADITSDVDGGLPVNELKFISPFSGSGRNAFNRFFEQTKMSIKKSRHKHWFGGLFDYFVSNLLKGYQHHCDEHFPYCKHNKTFNDIDVVVFSSRDEEIRIHRFAQSKQHAEYVKNIPIFVKMRELFGGQTIEELHELRTAMADKLNDWSLSIEDFLFKETAKHMK